MPESKTNLKSIIFSRPNFWIRKGISIIVGLFLFLAFVLIIKYINFDYNSDISYSGSIVNVNEVKSLETNKSYIKLIIKSNNLGENKMLKDQIWLLSKKKAIRETVDLDEFYLKINNRTKNFSLRIEIISNPSQLQELKQLESGDHVFFGPIKNNKTKLKNFIYNLSRFF